MSARESAIAAFLARHGWADAARRPLAGDASFRRYERLSDSAGKTALLMDAPPPQEDVRPYLRIARHLVSLGLSAPRVYAADEEAGLLLIEDFGDANMAALLARGEAPAPLYRLALDALVALQRQPRARAIELAAYDDERMLSEGALLLDWYVPAVSERPLSAEASTSYLAAWREVLPRARGVPASLVLRDFFPDNLMLLAGRTGVAACGLLDFQDAVIGPVSYDLVSLLEDARRDVPRELKTELIERYLAAFPMLGREALVTSAAVMSAQRNLRILGVFTRLCRRDGKPGYLAHIPRLWRLIGEALAHPALAPVAAWLERYLPPALRQVPSPTAAPARAMVLAAGLATRLRPLSERLPKPLVPIAGRTLIDRALDRLAAAGVAVAVVNTHHLAPLVEQHLSARGVPRIILSYEPELLETGGGIAKALPHLLPGPFYAINSDALWLDGASDTLLRLARAWDEARMDALLLLAPRASVVGYDGRGDFFLEADGRLRRRGAETEAPYLYIGLQLLSARLFDGVKLERFSLNRLWDRALERGRLFGLLHEGRAFDVGTLEGIALAEAALAAGGAALAASPGATR